MHNVIELDTTHDRRARDMLDTYTALSAAFGRLIAERALRADTATLLRCEDALQTAADRFLASVESEARTWSN